MKITEGIIVTTETDEDLIKTHGKKKKNRKEVNTPEFQTSSSNKCIEYIKYTFSNLNIMIC